MTHSAPPPEPPSIIKIIPTKPQLAPALVASQPVTTTSVLPRNVSNSAAALGAPIAVGYPLVLDEATTTQLDNTASTPTATVPKITISSSAQPVPRLKQVKPTRPLAVRFSQRPTNADQGNATDAANPETVEFNFSAPTAVDQQPPADPSTPPLLEQLEEQNQQQQQPLEQPSPQPPKQPPAPTQPATNTPPAGRRIVEVTADRQEYDQQRQVVTAEGNVLVRFDGAVLDADRLQVNLPNLIAVGEGNVALTRGEQVLRGERFTYNVVQDSGSIQAGSGEIFIPTASSDFSPSLPTDVSAGRVTAPQSDRITANQPLEQVSSPGGVDITVGAGSSGRGVSLPQGGGEVRRLRFEAEQIEFTSAGWQARDVRITNDPFSPPELELRANTVTLTRETPQRDRIRTTRQRLVFDQGFSLPIPRNQAVIDRQQRETSPGIVQFGIDGTDRGGVYIERGFTPIDTENFQLSLKPQYFVQQAIEGTEGGAVEPSQFGLKTNLRGNFGPRTALTGNASFTSLDLGEVENNLRANLQLLQVVGTSVPHTVTVEGAYRDRIYNGSLGYRTVQRSFGAFVNSPTIPIGDTGINLSYQAGIQAINADTDRRELLEAGRENNRVSLTRFQGTAAASRGFTIWRGKALAATPTAGLRYTPTPVVPSISAVAGVTLNSSFYTSGDNQTILTGTVGLQGQFGHFSRPWLDYTAFNVSYSQDLKDGESPFFFDRDNDNQTLSFGFTQQIYGPFRLRFQTSLNLDTGDSFSTDYILEYSRRTYGVTLRYNPELELGSLSFRISDFNWAGGTDPFSEDVRSPRGGVIRN